MEVPSGVSPAEIRAALLPPGVTANPHDPQTLEGVTVAIGVLMIIFTFLAVSARFYSTVLVTHSTGIEDYSCLLAVVLLYAYIGMVIYLKKYARHTWDLPATWIDTEYFKARFARDMFFSPATFFAKSSILLLYLRIFAPLKWFRYTIWSTIIFMGGVDWCYIGVNVGLCAPPPGKSWFSPDTLTKCEKQGTYAVIQGASNVAIDILILLLPLRIIWRLQIQRSKRVGILAIFLAGSIALVCSLISLAYRVRHDRTTDTFWTVAIIFIAIIVEVSVTIICSCAPAIFALGRHLFASQSICSRKSFRSRVPRTDKASDPSYDRHSDRGTHGYYEQPALGLCAAPRQNGYLELGEVAHLERKAQGAEFGTPSAFSRR